MLLDPMRQCQNPDGSPKKIFRDLEAAHRKAIERGGKYEAYVCCWGHAHVGRRKTAPNEATKRMEQQT